MTKEEFLKLPQYLLNRVYLEDRTLGSLVDARGGLIAKTLELPWKDNQRKISCIPEGEYLVTLSGPVLNDNPDTALHRGYNPSWSQGCILVSGRFSNVDSDQPTLEKDSGKKLQWMVENLPKQFRLLIDKKG
jgi:hypothetical protein